ncbi:tetratricopeptide repeat protein [Mariprofundus micogutta]|uniref:Tetratricopeptide repeat protein n=1 Tax=Mariprofundus micogutta TaxID=1921010 RepID=A0A1L8CME0_9PROT|nr:sulfotransferase [Mariprofundus micogutta]GAV20072.1 tetratricopeptide repeat protein [Mariprofundus micogutta]
MAVIKLSNKKKRLLMTLAEQAASFARKGQFQTALRICDKADGQYKGFLEITYVRGLIASMQNDYHTALDWLGQAYRKAPNRLHFQINYASCLLLNDQQEEAAQIYPEILKKSPKLFSEANGYSGLGSALEALGEFRQALQTYKQGLQKEKFNVELLSKAAKLHSKLGETSIAMDLLEKAHSAEPDNANVICDMVSHLFQQGEFEEARSRFRKAQDIGLHEATVLGFLIKSGNYADRGADLKTMRKLYDEADVDADLRIYCAFILGNEADKESHYKEAFDYWAEANLIRSQSSDNDECDQESIHQIAASAFPASRFTDISCKDASEAAPIFIIGMPRCGSTLLEQALARHPGLQPAGEIAALHQAVNGRKRKALLSREIEKLPLLDDNSLLTIGHEYSRIIAQEYCLDGRVTDKMLNNYLLAGVIAKALPLARIIHINREPMASCLSMFQENFSDGKMNYSCDLNALGRQYARYQKLMQHWRKVLPKGVMLEVSYEDLVSNPEIELRRLLEGCDLEWHPDCLSSHKTTGAVSTASLIQVRKPIHQKSVARWKHYEKQLEPIKQYLLPE